MESYEGWLHLRPTWRYAIAGIFIAVSAGLWLAGMFDPWGWGIGLAIILVTLASSHGH